MLDLGYSLLKPVLFSMDPETAHERVLAWVGAAPRLTRALMPDRSARVPVSLAGLELPGPVGLAAGLDKQAEALPIWDKLGFGFIELGTVTPQPQPGNPRPRVHRFPEHRAVVNAMGFPSLGMDAVVANLQRWRALDLWPAVPVGANLGKNKHTSADQAHLDYASLAGGMREHVDYFAVNVSSPNTPGLRDLQATEPLKRILGATLQEAGARPVLVKFAPDMTDEEIAASVETAIRAGAHGIIATNTTRRRMGLAEAQELPGGLSGAPLHTFALDRVKAVLAAAGGAVPVVGVGGICEPEDALAFLDAGCVAVQVYTGMIFAGPGLPGSINEAVAAR